MKRFSLGGPRGLVWLLVFLALSGYYLQNFFSQQRMIAAAGSQAEPRQFDIPRLKAYRKASTPLSSWQLWNLNPKPRSAAPGPVASIPKTSYAVKSFGHVQGLYSLKNQNVRWEFYGVVQQEGETLAVFFNPSLAEEGWVSIGQSQDLSPGLRLEEISENRVVILDTEGDVGKTWELTLFASEVPK